MPMWHRLDIYERDGFRCRYCGFDGTSFDSWAFLEVDHIDPGGPRDDPANLATCCHRCNAWKGNDPCTSIEEAREIIGRHRVANLAYWEREVVPRIRSTVRQEK